MTSLVTPFGFRDVLGIEAEEREHIVRGVQDLLGDNGFAPIETPTLEVMEVMNKGVRMPKSPFRFFDSRGDLLAMRPDVTLQVARMCATRLPKGVDQARFRYTQRVFRDVEGRTDAAPREITQIGVECIGEKGVETDCEIMRLFIESLRKTGVGNICIAAATVGPLLALLERSGADANWCDAVLAAYHDSDFVELDRLCDIKRCEEHETANIAPAYADVIAKLARVRGGIEAIDEAVRLVEPLGCSEGLSDLREVVESIVGNFEEEVSNNQINVLVDFSVMSSFSYYTGIVFSAYSPYLGTSLGSGGRYDNMVGAFGKNMPAAGFAFCLEQVMSAKAEEEEVVEDELISAAEDVADGEALQAALGHRKSSENQSGIIGSTRKLRIAVPKGALNENAVECLEKAGLDTEGLHDIGRQLVISTDNVDYIIVRPSDAPAFVAYGAADCGICGRDSLLESQAQVVELVDLAFGACRFVVAEPKGSTPAIEERYRKLGSIRVATKYPNIALAHYAKTGVQVDIVELHGNIELAPLTGMAERIVDITATGTTLRENNLVIVEEVLDSTARFFANPCSLRTDNRVVELARVLAKESEGATFDPIAGKAM